MNDLEIKQTNQVEILTTALEGAELPSYGTTHAAGADVRAFITEDLMILPGETALIPTGLHFAIPEGYEIQVRPRSGLAFKSSITVLNTPGTIDADYRGELKVLLINHGKETFVVQPGMRCAQIILAPVVRACFNITTELPTTVRGTGGFGHTGTH
jgi:dUTP pyrophosphatase